MPPAPGSPERLLENGELLRARGRLAEAQAAYARACALRPSDLAARLPWAEVLLRLGRLDRMREVLREGLELAPLPPGAGVEERLLRYRAAAACADFALAESLGESVLDLTRDLGALEGLCWPVLMENYSRFPAPRPHVRRMDAALDRYVRARPRSPWGRYLRLYLTERMIERRPSVKEDIAFLRGLDESRYGWMRYEAGSYGLHTGDPEGAAADFAAAERCSRPPSWRARCRIADARLSAGDAAGAKAALRGAEKLAGPRRRGAVLAHRAGVLLALGDYAGALRAVDEAVRAGARNFPHSHRGAALLMLGRPREALAALDSALRKEPEDAVSRLWRGEALLRLGRPRAAAAEALRARRDGGGFYASILLGLARGGAEAERALAGLPADVRALAGRREPRAALERVLALSRGLRKDGFMSGAWRRRA